MDGQRQAQLDREEIIGQTSAKTRLLGDNQSETMTPHKSGKRL